jgi:hypothetical protein
LLTIISVAFFGPIYAFISLFVCCLDGRGNPSDLSVMDVGIGFFAKLHLSTDSLVSVPFARALTSLLSDRSLQSSRETQVDQTRIVLESVLGPTDHFFSLDVPDGIFDMEDWSTFSRASPVDQAWNLGPGL